MSLDHSKEVERDRLKKLLIQKIKKMGYPEALGYAIAESLGTEKTLSRMLAYLEYSKPSSAEEITDEMLGILEDRKRWVQKKEAEYYNTKYNEMLYYGLGAEDEEI